MQSEVTLKHGTGTDRVFFFFLLILLLTCSWLHFNRYRIGTGTEGLGLFRVKCVIV